jgi:hypothetical protein
MASYLHTVLAITGIAGKRSMCETWIHEAVLRMKPRRKRNGMISGKQRTSRFITDS